MNWLTGEGALLVFQSVLIWIRDNASLIAILLVLCCIFYLRRMSQRLAAIGKVMNDVKWISAKAKPD